MENTNVETEMNETAVSAATVNLMLTVDEINLILASLQELPHRVVDKTLKNIIEQTQQQLKA